MEILTAVVISIYISFGMMLAFTNYRESNFTDGYEDILTALIIILLYPFILLYTIIKGE